MQHDNITPYQDSRSKGEQVESMFDHIAPAYDRMNAIMTGGLHRIWRTRAIKDALYQLKINGIRPSGMDALDVATGTGDLVFSIHHRLPLAQITGIDLSEGMLAIARQRLATYARSTQRLLNFSKADCLALPYADNSFDLVTVAYGVRNFENLPQGLREMRRVLRPNGVLCIIELSTPENNIPRKMYNLYAGKIIPMIGRLISGDAQAYKYLPQSIAAAPQRDTLIRMMLDAGLVKARWRSMTFGAVTIYIGEKHN